MRDNALAHKGFWERASSVPIDLAVDFLTLGANRQVLLTGHSLGAACAALYNERVHANLTDVNASKRIRCVTIGMPLLGNEELSTVMQTSASKLYSIIHRGSF